MIKGLILIVSLLALTPIAVAISQERILQQHVDHFDPQNRDLWWMVSSVALCEDF